MTHTHTLTTHTHTYDTHTHTHTLLEEETLHQWFPNFLQSRTPSDIQPPATFFFFMFVTAPHPLPLRFLLSRTFSPRVLPEPLHVPLGVRVPQFGNRCSRTSGPPRRGI